MLEDPVPLGVLDGRLDEGEDVDSMQVLVLFAYGGKLDDSLLGEAVPVLSAEVEEPLSVTGAVDRPDDDGPVLEVPGNDVLFEGEYELDDGILEEAPVLMPLLLDTETGAVPEE